MKTLRFHTGRGGRFYNGGHVTFIKFETIQETHLFDENYFYRNQEWYDERLEELREDNPELTMDDLDVVTGWFDGNGEELDCNINEDGTGYISDDGEYDSYQWVREDQLNENQVDALIRDMENHYEEEEMMRILKEYYPSYIPEIEDGEMI